GHMRVDGGAMRGGDVGGDVDQVRMDALAHARVEGADGADQLHAVGDDVVADAALDRAEGHDGRQPGQVWAAADDGLRTADDVGRGDDGVDAAPWARTVRLHAVDLDRELVGGRHQRPAANADRAGRQGRKDMQPEHRV